jgi:two-component system nitrogen regulation response regulator NtrX
MPHMGGIELAARLRQLHPNIAILFVSGRPLSSTGLSDTELRRERFLAKPFRPDELVSEVRRALQHQGVSAGAAPSPR